MDVLACRVCLATDCKLYNLNKYDLATIYTELTSLRVSRRDRLPQHICYLCCALLKKYSHFRWRCHNAYLLMKQAINTRKELTPKVLSSIDRSGLRLALSKSNDEFHPTFILNESSTLNCPNYLTSERDDVEEENGIERDVEDLRHEREEIASIDDDRETEHLDDDWSDTEVEQLLYIKQQDENNVAINTKDNEDVTSLFDENVYDDDDEVELISREPTENLAINSAQQNKHCKVLDSREKHDEEVISLIDDKVENVEILDSQKVESDKLVGSQQFENNEMINSAQQIEIDDLLQQVENIEISVEPEIKNIDNSQETENSDAIDLPLTDKDNPLKQVDNIEIQFEPETENAKIIKTQELDNNEILNSQRNDIIDVENYNKNTETVASNLLCDENFNCIEQDNLQTDREEYTRELEEEVKKVKRESETRHIQKKHETETHNDVFLLVVGKDLPSYVNLRRKTENSAPKRKSTRLAVKRKVPPPKSVAKKRRLVSPDVKYKASPFSTTSHAYYRAYGKKYNMDLKILKKTEQYAEFNARQDLDTYKKARIKCDTCFKGFVSTAGYKRHAVFHSPEHGAYSCYICHMYYQSKQACYRHLEEHCMRYTCLQCEETFDKRGTLRSHFTRHSGVQYKCYICQRDYSNYSSYSKHIQKHTGGVKCTLCGDSCINEQGLSIHMSVKHMEALDFVCETCEVYFENSEILLKHIDSGCSSDIRACPRCGQGFASDVQLAEHKKQKHSERKMFTCNFCNKSFHHSKNLGLHWRYMHYALNSARYMCEHCGRYFTRRQSFTHHMLTHSGEKPHKCPHCPRCFRLQRTLKILGDILEK